MLDGFHRVSGTAQDGVYSYQMTVPANAETGTWTVDNLLLVDQVGNMKRLNAADLSAAGLPTTLNNS